MLKYIAVLFVLLFINLHAYQSENDLKVVLTSKIASFVVWEDSNSSKFVITVLNNKTNDSFNAAYVHDTIKEKDVQITYIDDIKNLKFTNILYIQQTSSEKLKKIMQFINGKNILTVSDMRGFTEKGGIIQIYSLNQKLKLKINLDAARKANLQIKASLLRLVDVVGGNI